MTKAEKQRKIKIIYLILWCLVIKQKKLEGVHREPLHILRDAAEIAAWIAELKLLVAIRTHEKT